MFLNFLSEKYEKITEIFENKFSDSDFFNVLVRKFAVPSAVFNATLPVKPSVTIIFESPLVIWFPSIYPLNSKSPNLTKMPLEYYNGVVAYVGEKL